MSPWTKGKHPNTLEALREGRELNKDPLMGQRIREGLAYRRALNDTIDRKFGPGAEEALDKAGAIMRGQAFAKARRPGPTEDLASYAATVPDVGPSIREQLDAAQWIYEQRNGKAKPVDLNTGASGSGPQVHLGPEGVTGVSVALEELAGLSDSELDIMEALMSKVSAKDRTVDGQVLP